MIDSKTQINNSTISPINGSAEHAATDAYWTAERMNAAVPIPHPTDSSRSGEANENQESRSFKTQSHTTSNIVESPANMKVHPYNSGGRLFFKDADGNPGTCTAQFVGTKKTLLTAAHCLYDFRKSVFHTNFLFIRGYENGNGDRFNIRRAHIAPEYLQNNEDMGYDYGFMSTTKEYQGPHIGLLIDVKFHK